MVQLSIITGKEENRVLVAAPYIFSGNGAVDRGAWGRRCRSRQRTRSFCQFFFAVEGLEFNHVADPFCRIIHLRLDAGAQHFTVRLVGGVIMRASGLAEQAAGIAGAEVSGCQRPVPDQAQTEAVSQRSYGFEQVRR